MTLGMTGEHVVSAGKSKKKTFDTHVDGWILSLAIKEYAREVLECIQLAPNRARINSEGSCGSITQSNR
jgi:hypothetical protein